MRRVSITALAPEDVEAVCSLAREIWRAHYPPIIGAEQTEYMLAQRYDPETICAELQRDDVFWAVLREDDTIVAFASALVENPRELKLDKLYVHSSRQRSGLGEQLVEYVCDRGRTLGRETLTLAVNKHNERAIAAYRKYGFEIREAVVKDIGGGFVMDDYIMARSCGASR